MVHPRIQLRFARLSLIFWVLAVPTQDLRAEEPKCMDAVKAILRETTPKNSPTQYTRQAEAQGAAYELIKTKSRTNYMKQIEIDDAWRKNDEAALRKLLKPYMGSQTYDRPAELELFYQIHKKKFEHGHIEQNGFVFITAASGEADAYVAYDRPFSDAERKAWESKEDPTERLHSYRHIVFSKDGQVTQMLLSAISFGSDRLQPHHADHILFSYSGGRCRIKWLHADGAFFGLKQGKTVYGSPKICEAVQGKRRLSAEDSPAKVADLRAIFVKKLGFQNKTFATSREGINEVLLAHQEVCRRLSEFLTTPPPGSEAVPPPPNQAIKRSGQM